MEPAQHGNIKIGVNWIKVAPVIFAREPDAPDKKDVVATNETKQPSSKETYLHLVLSIANLGETARDYRHPLKSEVTLKDELGNPFPAALEGKPGRIEGQIASATIPAKQAIEDVLVFVPANLRKGKNLLLDLSARCFGGEGSIKIRMGQGMVR